MGEFKYQLIDLGLPSGTLWMDRNIGASCPEDAGLYFAWGETQGYTADEVGKIKQFGWEDYKFGMLDKLTKYNETDGLTTLETVDDAVSQNISDCTMPTDGQIVELIKETDVYCIKVDGTEISGTWNDEDVTWNGEISSIEPLRGIEFRKKGDNSVKIFIPCAGDGMDSMNNVSQRCSLWSKSLDGDYITGAYFLIIDFINGYCGYSSRFVGFPLRGVKNKEN